MQLGKKYIKNPKMAGFFSFSGQIFFELSSRFEPINGYLGLVAKLDQQVEFPEF